MANPIHVDRTSIITDLTGFFFQLLHLATKHLNLLLITTWESGKGVQKIGAAFPPGKGFAHQINVNTVLVLFVTLPFGLFLCPRAYFGIF